MKCQAITKSGAQCSRDAKEGSKFCWQHQNAKIVDNDDLTDKQQAFCEEYLIDLNATQAAIRAGYSEKTAENIGCENLKKPKIQEEIRRLKSARSKRTEVTADKVLQELSKIGFADIKDFLSFRTEKVKAGEDGSGANIYEYQTVVELKESDKVDGKAISEVQLKDGDLKFKLYDKLKALRDIGRHLGMWNDSLDITMNELPDINLVRGDNGDG